MNKFYADIARDVFDSEINELQNVKNKIDNDFNDIIQSLIECSGKIIVSGVGKSGHIGKKIASTLTSVGKKSIFVHATEAVHGDLGYFEKNDIVIVISNTGNSPEIVNLLPHLKNLNLKIIAMTGKRDSTLGLAVDFILDIGVEKEACDIASVPTSSTTATLVMGDALASVLVKATNFTEEDFTENHPGGGIGKRLKLKVKDLMHPVEDILLAGSLNNMEEIIKVLNTPVKNTGIYLGAALVVNNQGNLEGLITFGDLRKAMSDKHNFFSFTASKIMNSSPYVINEEESAFEALKYMESFKAPLSLIPVTDNSGKLKGCLHFHDIFYQVGK